MKRVSHNRPRLVSVASLAVGALCLAATAMSTSCLPGRDHLAIVSPPLRAFKPEAPKRIELQNGLVVYLVEDHELPLVHGSVVIRGGSLAEPEAKTGLMEIYGEVWRTGGTTARTGDQLDDDLESRAAKVETSGDSDSTGVSFSCLKGDLDYVFDAWLEVLQKPTFREEKIALAKAQLATGIARRNDSAGEIMGRESAKLAYGPRSPIARYAEYATVKAITQADLVAWHQQHLRPNLMIVSVVGDFDAAAMERKLRAAFESLPRGEGLPAVDLAIAEPAPGVYLVEKNDVNQSSIRMLHLGTTKRDPDYHAIVVANEVFGGGFSSRLFSTLRTKKGLAYSVGGGVGADYAHPGVTRLAIGTKSRTTGAAIDGLFAELDRLKTEPPTDAEVQRAKDSILNSFVFRYDSKSKLMRERMLLEFYGYPKDFVEQFKVGVEKVTAVDVARVLGKHFDKARMRIVVVGKPADFDKPLSAYGPVKKLDIKIPGP